MPIGRTAKVMLINEPDAFVAAELFSVATDILDHFKIKKTDHF